MKSRSVLLVIATFLCPGVRAADDLSEKADALLNDALTHRNPDTRKHAIVALSLAASRAPYLSRLIGMLHDKDAEVRLAAVSCLSEVKTTAVAAELRKTLEDDVPEVSFAAAKALWTQRDPAGKLALMAVLTRERQRRPRVFCPNKSGRLFE